jgi:integrase
VSVRWLTTKCTNAKKALKIAKIWEAGARLAAAGELTQPLAQRLVKDVEREYKHPDTLKITRDLANELLRDSLGESLAGQNFPVFVAEWLESRRVHTAASSFGKYKSVTNGFLEFLPPARRIASVSSISTRDLRQYRDLQIQRGKSAKTTNVEMAILSAVFNDAFREAIVSHNPARALKPLPDDGEERLPFSASEIKSILEVGDVEWTGMILFAAHCGLRIGDCAKLTWENVVDHETLRFTAAKTQRTKRLSDKKTVVVLHGDLTSYLQSLPAGDDPKQTIFPTLSRLPVGSAKGLSALFSQLMAKAGVFSQLGRAKSGRGRVFKQLSFHSLRHAFASRLANAEVGHDVRQQMGGWSSGQIADKYVHMDLSLQRAAVAKMPSLL